jgi:hypothetical protein
MRKEDPAARDLLQLKKTWYWPQVKYALQQIQFIYFLFWELRGLSSQFPHSWVCERFKYSQDRSTYFLQQNRQIDRGNI